MLGFIITTKKITIAQKRFSHTIVGLCLLIALQSCSSIDLIQKESSLKNIQLENVDQINLLTYNIDAISSKNDDQVTNLVSHINKKEYDFVLLQEVFSESTRNDIVEQTNTEHYNTIVSRVDFVSFPEFFFQDSGLFLMSRYPRIDLSELDFGSGINNDEGFMFKILEKEFSRSYDYLANKSVLGALFKVSENQKVFLFTSHVQALGSSEGKEFQLEEIMNFISSGINKVYADGIVKKNDNLSVIFAGDLNVDAYNNTWKLNKVTHTKLMGILKQPRDLHKEFNGDKRENTWTWRSNSQYGRRFDYILAYDSLEGFHFNKIAVNEMKVISILDNKKKAISDHKGISTKLKLN